MKTQRWLILIPMILLFSVCKGQDRIVDLYELIVIEQDGALTITDSLQFFCDGKRMRELIGRRWPLFQRTREGDHLPLDVEIVHVSRDGADEPYGLSHDLGGARVEIGQSGAILARGVHTYSIIYRTTPQIDHQEDFDELTWSLDVGYWDLLIDRATVTIRLPRLDGAVPRIRAALGKNAVTAESVFSVLRGAGGTVTFSTLKSVSPTQPFLLAVSFADGYVERPSNVSLATSYLEKNTWIVVDFVGILLLLGYYLFAWKKVGVDPPKETVIPRFEPPENLSPAALRYIMNRGYDNKILAVTILDMALKEFLTVGRGGQNWVLTKHQMTAAQLTPLETLVAYNLFESDTTIELNQNSLERFLDVIDLLKGWFKREHGMKYFSANTAYYVPGVAFTIIVLMFTHVFRLDPQFAAGAITLLVWGFIAGTILARAFGGWGAAVNRRLGRASNISALLGIVLLLLIVVLTALFGGLARGVEYPGIFAGSAAVFIFINLLFYRLLEAPTKEGRRLMDEIEGFKLFLTTAEKDQLAMQASAQKVPKSLERYFPYAIALDVLHGWADQFAERLTQLQGNRINQRG